MSLMGLLANLTGDEPMKLTYQILDSWEDWDDPADARTLRGPVFARTLDAAVAYLSSHGIHEALLNALATGYYARAQVRDNAEDLAVANAMMAILYDLGERGRFGLGRVQLAHLAAERVGSMPGTARLRIARNLCLLTELLPVANFDEFAADSFETALRSGDLTLDEASEAQHALEHL